MADPLSPATRATKRNLLIASVLAISANAFNVSIDKIPLAGLSVNFDDRLFAFLLVVSLVYFLCTFVLYYFIDIKNLEPTQHQEIVEKEYHERLVLFPQRYSKNVHNDLQTLAPEGCVVATVLGFDPSGNADAANSSFSVKKRGPAYSPDDGLRLPQQENAAVYAAIQSRLDLWRGRYSRAFRANRRRAAAMVSLIRATYSIRNYFFDGALPILLGLFALIAIIGHVDLRWIQNFLPSFKVLSP
jgi:hypothetical protein